MNNFLYSFEKLEVWKIARKMVGSIYELTKKIPTEEKFVITSQIRRAAISIIFNH
jgi:four helix bundle protein